MKCDNSILTYIVLIILAGLISLFIPDRQTHTSSVGRTIVKTQIAVEKAVDPYKKYADSLRGVK